MLQMCKLPTPPPPPAGLSGLGQIVPGLKPETMRLVIYSSLALIGISVGAYIVLTRMKKRKS